MSANSNADEERWRKFFQNDRDAQVELFQQYGQLVSLVSFQLKRRLPTHIRLDDLQAAGLEGLWRAMQSFSLDRGVPFEQYARTRIRGAMLDELRRLDEATRTQRTQLRQAQAAYGTHRQHVQVSLEDDARHEWIVDENAISPEWAAVRSSEVQEINRALMRLSEQERLVLSLVFVEELSLAEAAEVLSLSRSRVSTIKNDALKSLRGFVLQANRAKR